MKHSILMRYDEDLQTIKLMTPQKKQIMHIRIDPRFLDGDLMDLALDIKTAVQRYVIQQMHYNRKPHDAFKPAFIREYEEQKELEL